MKTWIALLSLVALPALAATPAATPSSTPTSQMGGSTLPSDTATLSPEQGTTRAANEELRSGTASTGGTGTTLDTAGEGSTSNTTGTGAVGSSSGKGSTVKPTTNPSTKH